MTWSAKLAPWLAVADAGRAGDFYQSAFGAVEPKRLEGDVGVLQVARLRIGESNFRVQFDPGGNPHHRQIALPHIQRALHFSTTSLSWVLSAYTLTFGRLLLLGGRAGDILGRRRVFITGILLFSLASLLGGLATSSGWLLAARALQGVGGAIASPTARP
jgi:hypothetical protein